MAARGLLLMGQCMPCIKQNASKIRIRRMELDKNLNMVRCVVYFRRHGILILFSCSTGLSRELLYLDHQPAHHRPGPGSQASFDALDVAQKLHLWHPGSK